MSKRATLGTVIRQRRRELGWTQEELAERISSEDEYVRQSEISRIENGRILLPRRERLERLAEVLDLPLGELLARSGWAGADDYFKFTVGQNGDAEADDVLLTEHGISAALSNAERFLGDDLDPNSQDCSNAVLELRRAVLRLRAQSERLERNRDHMLETLERIRLRRSPEAGSPAQDMPGSAIN